MAVTFNPHLDTKRHTVARQGGDGSDEEKMGRKKNKQNKRARPWESSSARPGLVSPFEDSVASQADWQTSGEESWGMWKECG